MPPPVSHFTGARYALTGYSPECPNAPREIQIDMSDYAASMAKTFEEESGTVLRSVSTPFLPDDRWARTT